MAYLQWKDAYIQPSDFGHKDSANYQKFVIQDKLYVQHSCTAIEVLPKTRFSSGDKLCVKRCKV